MTHLTDMANRLPPQRGGRYVKHHHAYPPPAHATHHHHAESSIKPIIQICKPPKIAQV